MLLYVVIATDRVTAPFLLFSVVIVSLPVCHYEVQRGHRRLFRRARVYATQCFVQYVNALSINRLNCQIIRR